MDLPTELMKLELSDQEAENPTLSSVLSNVDLSTISYFGEFLSAPCTVRTYPTHDSEIIEHCQWLLPRLQHTLYDWYSRMDDHRDSLHPHQHQFRAFRSLPCILE